MRGVIRAGMAAVSIATCAVGFVSAQADPASGRTVFNQKCSNCHTLSADPAHGPKGPNLMGVIGRPAGTIQGWEFSAALRQSGITWSDDTLTKWLTDPAAFVPGSDMAVKVTDRFEREDVIAYIRMMTDTRGAANK